ncbi:MAG TPA: hypothetical protein VF970_14850 [Gemmatimonadales bacterium]
MVRRDELEELASQPDGPKVSLYLPTHRVGGGAAEDLIRWKNLLARADHELAAQGVRAAGREELLAPARSLSAEHGFWRIQGAGLGVFLSADGMRVLRLPLRVEELVVVGPQYHLKPLLAVLSGNGRFFVLALSLNRVRLWEATRDTIREDDLHDIPATLRDAVGYDFEERSLQFHTAAPRAVGGVRTAIYHGEGGSKDDLKGEITTFLRLVDEGVTRLLQANPAPLVLAGVDYITSMYRKLTKHPLVLRAGVRGNPDHMSGEELRAKAWKVVAPRFAAEQRRAVERYEALKGEGRASNDVRRVAQAAEDGRVELVLIGLRAHMWGSFDPLSRRVEVHDVHRPGDRDLVDLVAMRVLRTGGVVYVMDDSQVPDGRALAAVFRF